MGLLLLFYTFELIIMDKNVTSEVLPKDQDKNFKELV